MLLVPIRTNALVYMGMILQQWINWCLVCWPCKESLSQYWFYILETREYVLVGLILFRTLLMPVIKPGGMICLATQDIITGFTNKSKHQSTWCIQHTSTWKTNSFFYSSSTQKWTRHALHSKCEPTGQFIANKSSKPILKKHINPRLFSRHHQRLNTYTPMPTPNTHNDHYNQPNDQHFQVGRWWQFNDTSTITAIEPIITSKITPMTIISNNVVPLNKCKLSFVNTDGIPEANVIIMNDSSTRGCGEVAKNILPDFHGT